MKIKERYEYIRKIFIRNKSLIVTFFVVNSLIVGVLFFFFEKIKKHIGIIDIDVHYNFLTINTFFAGFLYNMLGTMVEFTSRKEIKILEKNGYMDQYFNSVYVSMFFFIMSIIVGVVCGFFKIGFANIYLYLIELIFMIEGVVYFIKSAFKLRNLINKVRHPIDDSARE